MKNFFAITLCTLVVFSCATTEKASKSKTPQAATANAQTPKKKNGKIKDYDKVITKDAKTDEGLFDVHMVGEKYYYEIPMEYLNTDMLLVSRLAK